MAEYIIYEIDATNDGLFLYRPYPQTHELGKPKIKNPYTVLPWYSTTLEYGTLPLPFPFPRDLGITFGAAANHDPFQNQVQRRRPTHPPGSLSLGHRLGLSGSLLVVPVTRFRRQTSRKGD